MTRVAALLTCALALAGCGPEAALWLRVEAPLAVPQECDALALTVRRGAADGPISFEETFDLQRGPAFPLTLSLTADSLEGGDVFWVQAAALRGGELSAPWAQAGQEVSLRRGDMVEATLRLCDCP